MCPTLPITNLRSTRSQHARDSHGRRAAVMVPLPLSGFAGVWEGALYRDGSAVGLPFSLLQSVVADASGSGGVGHVAFPGRDDSVAADVTLLEASATTYVALVGPYYDATLDAQVVMLLDARRAGDRMTGTYRVRVVAGGHCVDGHFVAVKSRRAAAA